MNRKGYFLPIIFLFLILNNIILTAQTINDFNKENYIKNKIIFKIKPEYRNICKNDNIIDKNLNSLFSTISIKNIKKIFPNAERPKSKYNKNGDPLTDLSLIYESEFNSDIPISKILEQIKKNPIIEYAQPHYLPELLYSTNDTYAANQYYLDNIKAYQAWDISKGDSTIIIGITDTGVQIDHEDLIDNISYNYNDPIDGIDNDLDGFTDNFRGWDLGDNDNNPQWNENNYDGSEAHGVYVSGLACARTDNLKGISGTGFKTKFLPVKISDSTGTLTMAYEGIVYAADHGCSIINCSWGGKVSHPYGQDIINYATFNKNALVISASGNNGHLTNDLLYPCAYENVLCVGATDNNDLKWNHSCYGSHVDLCAPGVNVLTTFENNTYDGGWGTSFASPITAGCAAIIKAYYDTLSALQIGEILKITADNIDTISGNTQYAQLMGTGRVNLYRALTDTFPPSIKFSNIYFYDNKDENFNANDTVFIKGKYTNYLMPSKNLIVTLTSLSQYASVIDSINNIGILGTLDTILNFNNPFIIKILPNIPSEENILLKLTYNDTGYNAIQFINLVVNKSFINIDTNNIYTTITSNGRIGFNNYLMLNGNGFGYKHCESLLSECGFLIGNSITRVSDCLYGNYDFKTLDIVQKIDTGNVADLFIKTKFNDDNSGSKLNIDIFQNVYAWCDSANADYIILEYFLLNNNNFTINNIYAGIFADWDIINSSANKISYDSTNRFSYTYTTGQNNLFAGIKLLSNTPINHYAIDYITGGNGGLDITDGFSKQEEFYALSTSKDNAGIGISGNDVADVLSTGPLSIAKYDTVKIAFALFAAKNIYTMKNIATSAQKKYDSLYYVNNISLTDNKSSYFHVFPNPANDFFNIAFNLNRKSNVMIELIDITGKTIKIIKNEDLNKGNYLLTLKSDFPKGLYFIRYISDNKAEVKKISIL